MKRRQRRQVLDVNGEQSDSPRRRWQSKAEENPVNHTEQNGGPSNPLSNLLEQYNSDSEPEDSKPEGKQLDDKVNDFLKEIQMIAPEVPTVQNMEKKPHSSAKPPQESQAHSSTGETSCLWQECFDESTGYPYYWHTRTNEVTWEVPEELRLLRERNQQDSLSRTSYSTQWVNYSSNTYPQPQINIPEGMIPKEVVARNRNRQVSSQQNLQQTQKIELNTSQSTTTKDEETDDGKIEMITSFGSDDSDSETSDTDSPIKKSPKEILSTKIHAKEKSIKQASKSSSSAVKKLENSDKSLTIGPFLPPGIVPLVHGPENCFDSNEKWRKKEGEKSREHRASKAGQKLESSGKNSTETCFYGLKKFGTRGRMEEEASSSRDKELKISLVPGYADDSDNEEETPVKKSSNVTPLFPITEFSPSTTPAAVTQEGIVKKNETKFPDSGCTNIFQHYNEKSENSNSEKQMNPEAGSESPEMTNAEELTGSRFEDETPKQNIFLENLETPAKAFQRKRRIAFDVIPSKRRTPEMETVNKSESPPSPPPISNETDRHGLGFQKESGSGESDNSDLSDGKLSSPTTEKPNVSNKSSAISFVKGETMVVKSEEIVKEKTEEEVKELKKVTETIMEKLKFLSEGGQPASAVQVMAIQLQTLLAAWEAHELKDSYLENWLTGTGRELERLEEAAAPPGWDCQWDRSHKRYFYRNATSGEAQWTYPEVDVIGGTEEMELCTTPPPQDQEEPCIIETQVKEFQEVSTTSMEPERSKDETIDGSCLNTEKGEIAAPPPPQISSPSPPPPPRIFAEDMKRSKKRTGKLQGIDVIGDRAGTEESNGDETIKPNKETVNPPLPPSPTKTAQPPLPPHPPIVPNPPSNEPLPPGVDPPDMPFALNAATIETTMLYTPAAPQTNPIYAATIADPAILGHHTALMQSQLMHYPTYHQHLHNQALIAAANRLTGQEAVQFMVDYSHVYANTQVIAKPPIKSHKETLGSAIDSFYNDIASIEKIRKEHETEQLVIPVEPLPVVMPQIPIEVEQPPVLTDAVLKERKKKKAKVGISKKQKEVSSMVAKWQKAQHYDEND